MKHINKILSCIIILNNILFSHSEDPLCKFNIAAPVNLSPPDLAEIIRFLQSQQVTPDLVDDIVATELDNLQDVSDYEAGSKNEDIHMHITKLIRKYGYEVEEHEVTTKDGYKLTMQRIPGTGRVVLLVHGQIGSADDWVTAGPKSGLAYVLADAGYDVWLANVRGNKHSKKHISMSPECAEFWDFSFDEIARYDLPCMIDYVLELTGHDKLAYVGLSQGTTVSLVLCSELPEYNKKISLMVELSAVAWCSHAKSPIFRLLALNNGLSYKLLEAIGVNKILPYEFLYEPIADVVCGDNPLAKIVCSNVLALFAGFDRGHFNITNLPVPVGHITSEIATKQIIHYTQLAESTKFHNFDYGESKNKEVYGSSSPPDYPVEKITAPVAIFYSNADWVADKTDLLTLCDKLPNLVDFHFIEHYNHIDYQFAKDVKEVVYDRVLKLIKQYN